MEGGLVQVLIKVNVRYNLVAILAIIFFCEGCKSDVDLDTDRIGLNYFPLEVGLYRVYDVIETNYTVLDVKKEHYQLKESVADSGINASGNLTYMIHRSTRLNDMSSWQLDSVWTAQKNTSTAVLTENNVPFVKLSFPVENLVSWDGNRLNSLENETYFYDTNIPDSTIAEITYQQLVKVVQNELEEDFLGLDHRFETYAADIGMVFKESVVLKYCQSECGEEEKKIDAGRSIVMTISSYGKD